MGVARQGGVEMADVWARLAAPVPADRISWRQDGNASERDGKFFARFVCYIEANTVRERLDDVVPGQWTLHLRPLRARDIIGRGGEVTSTEYTFVARLRVLGIVREDVGTGRDYKAASTDAFKRVAVRFGIGHELYEAEQNWVQVSDGGKYAKPLEDPAVAYRRRHGALPGAERDAARAQNEGDQAHQAPAPARSSRTAEGGHAERHATPDAATATDGPDDPSCPKCGGRMWDNRATKRNPRAPDFKCRDRGCDGVIWPPRKSRAEEVTGGDDAYDDPYADDESHLASAMADEPDDLPF